MYTCPRQALNPFVGSLVGAFHGDVVDDGAGAFEIEACWVKFYPTNQRRLGLGLNFSPLTPIEADFNALK